MSVAEPITACEAIQPPPTTNGTAYVALIQRGPRTSSCDFVNKVRFAQDAGFSAVVVFDDVEEDIPVMGGKAPDIVIPAVMVTLDSGTFMKQNANQAIVHITRDQVTEWPPFMMTFVIVCSSAIFAFTVYMFYRQRSRRTEVVPAIDICMTQAELNRLPKRKFEKSADGSNAASCCICLAEYETGDLLVALTCGHEFHNDCITPWLTRRRRTCPLCKRDPCCDRNSSSVPLLINAASATRDYSTFASDHATAEETEPLLSQAQAEYHSSVGAPPAFVAEVAAAAAAATVSASAQSSGGSAASAVTAGSANSTIAMLPESTAINNEADDNEDSDEDDDEDSDKDANAGSSSSKSQIPCSPTTISASENHEKV